MMIDDNFIKQTNILFYDIIYRVETMPYKKIITTSNKKPFISRIGTLYKGRGFIKDDDEEAQPILPPTPPTTTTEKPKTKMSRGGSLLNTLDFKPKDKQKNIKFII